jgi:hypothetical protein
VRANLSGATTGGRRWCWRWHQRNPELRRLTKCYGKCAFGNIEGQAGLLITGSQAAAGGYKVKSSDVLVPKGSRLVSTVASIHPFENWILICDENQKTRRKMCNISQTFNGHAFFASHKGATFILTI